MTTVDPTGDAPESRGLAGLLLDEAPAALVAATPEGRVFYWNARAERAFAHSREQALGRLVQDLLFSPHRRAEAREAIRLATEQGTATIDTAQRGRDGRVVDLRVTVKAVRGSEGLVELFAIDAQDVTDSKALVEEVRRRCVEQETLAWLGRRVLEVGAARPLLREATTAIANALEVSSVEILERAAGSEALSLVASSSGVPPAWPPGGGSREILRDANEALRSRAPVVRDAVAPHPSGGGAFDSAATAIVPILEGFEAFGVVVARAGGKRDFREEELRFLRGAAGLLGLAVSAESAQRERGEASKSEREARAAAGRALRRASFLGDASCALHASLDVDAVLAAAARCAAPSLGDACVVHLLAGSWRLAGAHPADCVDEDAPWATPASVAENASATPVPSGDGETLGIPVLAGGRAVAVLSVHRARGAFTDEELSLAAELGRRVAAALVNARAHAAEREARQVAEQRARLQVLTDALTRPLVPSEVAALALEQAVPILGATVGALHFAPPGAEPIEIERCAPDASPFPPGAARRMLEAAARCGAPIRSGSGASAPAGPGPFPDDGGAFEAIPLVLEGATLGGLVFRYPSTRAMTESDRDTAGTLAQLVTQALSRAREYEAERTALKALRESEEGLARILDAIAEGILIYDRRGRITFANPAAERILGVPRPEILDRAHDDPRWGVRALDGGILRPGEFPFARASSGREPVQGVELTVERPAGGRIPLAVNAVPLSDAAGAVGSVVATFTDVADRKRSEAFLAGQARVLERIASGAPLPEILSALARFVEGQLEGTRGLATLFDDRSGRLRVAAAPSLPATFVASVDGLAIGPMAASCGAAAYSRAPAYVADAADDLRWANHRDLARDHDVGAAWSVPVLSLSGRLLGTVDLYSAERGPPSDRAIRLLEVGAHFASIAIERTWAEEALRQSEERYRFVVEGASDYAMYLLDPAGRVVSWNSGAERIKGYRAEEIIGEYFSRFYASEDDPEAPEAALRVASARGRHEEEGWRVRKDGSRFFANVIITPLRDVELRGYSIVVRDVTERKLAQQELEAARRQIAMSEKLSAMGTLVSGVAHEIRTPLTYLQNNVFLIEQRLARLAHRQPDLAPGLREVLDLANGAVEGADRINRLVGELRRFTRLRAGDRVQAGLEEVVEGAVDLFRATHRGRVQVRADLQPTETLELDRAQIQQIVINLLDNAADAMPRGGTVRVSTMRGEGSAIIVIEDEGTGIPPEVQARIFDPFFTTKPEGTGLGLSIVRRIVEGHGGSLRFETRPGKGTTFHVTLPARRE